MVERIRMLLEIRQLTPTQFADAIGVARPIVSHILSGRNKPSLEVVQRILAAMPDLSMPWLLNGTGPVQGGIVRTVSAPLLAPVAAPEVQVAEAEDRMGYAAVKPSEPEAPTVVPGPELPTNSAAVPYPQNRCSGSLPIASRVASSVPAPAEAAPQVPPTAFQRPALTIKAIPKRFAAASFKAAAQVSATGPTAPISNPVALHSQSAAVLPAPAAAEEIPRAAPLAVPDVAVEKETSSVGPEPLTTATALLAGGKKPIRRIVIFYRDGSFADYQPE